MAAPSGNFASSLTGRLQVQFSGEFWSTSGSDWGSGTSELVIKCTVGPAGSGQQVAYIRLTGSQTATLERDYVGGSGNVPIAMEHAAHSWDGPGAVAAQNLRITCRLFPFT